MRGIIALDLRSCSSLMRLTLALTRTNQRSMRIPKKVIRRLLKREREEDLFNRLMIM